jgi:hypothetical protein
MNDLHAENDNHRGEFPTGVLKQLGELRSHSIKTENQVNGRDSLTAIAVVYGCEMQVNDDLP